MAVAQSLDKFGTLAGICGGSRRLAWVSRRLYFARDSPLDRRQPLRSVWLYLYDVLLITIAIFIAIRIKALLIGRSADPYLTAAIEEHIVHDTDIQEIFNVITLQLGPQVMLAAKIKMRGDLSVDEACKKINLLEEGLKLKFPEIAWCFVEPDIRD